jgi:hypothetical protein
MLRAHRLRAASGGCHREKVCNAFAWATTDGASSNQYFNTSGRNLEDHVSVLNIDQPGADGLFGVRKLKTAGYEGATGDQSLDVLGLDAERLSNGAVRLWLVNMRPSVDESKALVDQSAVGANSTVEVFDVQPGSDEMVHVRTVADRSTWSLNNLALDGEGGFYYTNDRSSKGIRILTLFCKRLSG